MVIHIFDMFYYSSNSVDMPNIAYIKKLLLALIENLFHINKYYFLQCREVSLILKKN